MERDLVAHLAHDRVPVGVPATLLIDIGADADHAGSDRAALVVEITVDRVAEDHGRSRGDLVGLDVDRERRPTALEPIEESHHRSLRGAPRTPASCGSSDDSPGPDVGGRETSVGDGSRTSTSPHGPAPTVVTHPMPTITGYRVGGFPPARWR